MKKLSQTAVEVADQLSHVEDDLSHAIASCDHRILRELTACLVVALRAAERLALHVAQAASTQEDLIGNDTDPPTGKPQ